MVRRGSRPGARESDGADGAAREYREDARRQTSFEQAAVGMLEVGLDRRVMHANRRAEELLRYEEHGLDGLSLDAVTHPADIGAERHYVDALANRVSGAFAFEQRCLRKDGGVMWALCTLSLAVDQTGTPDYLVLVLQDIGSQKLAEQLAREAHLAFWDWDSAQDVIVASPSASDVYGLIPGESIDSSSFGLGLVHPADAKRHKDMVLAAARRDEGWHSEFRIVRPRDGLVAWLEERAIAVRDPVTGRVHHRGLVWDVTKRKQAEEQREAARAELSARSRFFRAMLSSVPDNVFAFDRGHRFVYANRSGLELLGLQDEELVGRSIAAVGYSPELAARLDGHIDQVFRTGEWIRDEIYLTSPSGIAGYFDFIWGPVRGEGEVIELVVGVSRNTTERRLLEAQLRTSEAEKTARDERERLARDLHDSVTQALFAASLKAEAVANSAADLPPDVAASVEEMRRLSRGALAQMRTMLLELRGDPIEDVPIAQLIGNAVQATEGRSAVKITAELDGDGDRLPPQLHVALYRITQESLNNIARHARARHAWVKLSMTPAHVHLVIGDDGRGFEPGPVDPTHVGLASMRERAREAGADLKVDGASGKGTVVTLDWRRERPHRRRT